MINSTGINSFSGIYLIPTTLAVWKHAHFSNPLTRLLLTVETTILEEPKSRVARVSDFAKFTVLWVLEVNCFRLYLFLIVSDYCVFLKSVSILILLNEFKFNHIHCNNSYSMCNVSTDHLLAAPEKAACFKVSTRAFAKYFSFTKGI